MATPLVGQLYLEAFYFFFVPALVEYQKATSREKLKDNKKNKMAPIGIALLGSGIFAHDEHKPAINACKDFELKAVYSRTKKSAENLFGGGFSFLFLFT